MSKTNEISIQIRFIDLMNKPLANLYHEVRVSGDKYAASAGNSNSEGLGVWIEKPIGTQLDILVRHPLTKELVPAKHRVIVQKNGIFRVQAPFSVQRIKLRQLSEGGNTLRKTYKVLPGDDLYSIAKKFGTTWQILFELNKDQIKQPDKIFPGRWIKIPPKGSSLTGKTNDKPDSLTSQTHYEVKKGETLSGISQRSGVSVEELQRINGISRPEVLQTGQTIKLRGNSSTKPQTSLKPNPVTKHKPTVSSSDKEEGLFDSAMGTMTDMAKGTVGVIGGAVGSIGDGLGTLGEKAKENLEGLSDAMSSGKNDKPFGQINGSDNSVSPISATYTVKSGDTLSGIAQKRGVDINILARTNDLKLTDTIRPGDRLKIPKGGSSDNSSLSSDPSSQSSKTKNPINVTTEPGNSNNGTPKEIVTTKGACICKAHSLIWGNKFDCDERLKVIEICKELWPNNYLKTANNLMAVFAWESGEKFETGAPNRRNSGGTGLIQIIPSTYQSLTGQKPVFETVQNYWGDGKPLRRIKQLADMQIIQYLDIVKDYFKPIENKDLEFVDFYLQVLFPASSGIPEHVVFAKNYSDLDLPSEKESIKIKRVEKFSRNNMDKNNDNIVMKSEIAQSIKHFIKDGERYKAFDKCEKFNIIEKPFTPTLCANNIKNCLCQTLNVNSNGIVLNSEVKQEPNNKMQDRISDVKAIIIHRTAGGSALSSISWGRKQGNGAHFYVDSKKGVEGQIYQTVSLNTKAYHMGVAQFPKTKQAGIGNSTTISIEVAGLSYDKNGKQSWVDVDRWEDVTDKQARSVACLLVALMKKYNFTYDKVHFHEDLCNKQRYEGRLVWIAMKKYLPNPPTGNKPAPYRNSKLILDPRFPEE